MKRIKSLDGIRAISILMVLLGHACLTLPPGIIINTQPFSIGAQLGVRIFFVISGYLITKLMLIENEKTGTVSLKDFYIRRIFRIFPIFYLYIIVVLLLKWFFIPHIFDNYSLVFYAGTYLWNYKHFFLANSIDNGNWFFGHFWSLSMEEQFYLLWPVAFISISKPKLIKLTIGIICIMPLIRIATWILTPNYREDISNMLHTGGDTIFIGCLGALVEGSAYFKDKWFKHLYNNYLIFATALLLFVISPLLGVYLKASYNFTIGESVGNVCILILLFWCIYIPSKVSDILNNKLLVKIGILSYSIYIWQQLFLTNKNDLWCNRFPQNLLVALAVGLLSYHIIEKPILNLKKKFKKV